MKRADIKSERPDAKAPISETNWDSAELADPSARGGELGADNEMPEGGDSTRFTPAVREELARRRARKAA